MKQVTFAVLIILAVTLLALGLTNWLNSELNAELFQTPPGSAETSQTSDELPDITSLDLDSLPTRLKAQGQNVHGFPGRLS